MFNLLSRKKQKPLKKAQSSEQREDESQQEETSIPDYLTEGKGTIWDIIAPDGIDLTHKNTGYLADSLAGERPFRPMYIIRSGWPRKLQTDWISLFTETGETDVTIYFEKIPPRQAVQSMQRLLTVLQSNLASERKRGNIDQLTDIETKIHDTQALMEDTAFGENDLFHVSVQACTYAEDEEMLDRLTNFLEDELGGQFIHLRSAYKRIKQGYLSVLPRGRNELKDTYRNLDRRALSTLFPFASSELRYSGGFPFAINQHTGNLVFLNLFAPENMNYNAIVLGESGSGKSFAVKTIFSRALLQGVHTAILDPEGEYKKVTRRLGGIYLKISPESPIVINPCAVSVTEIELDEDDEELKTVDDGRKIIRKDDGKEYVRFVPVKEKINEILSFFAILVQGDQNEPLNNFEEMYLEEAISAAFAERGITADPDSLYEQKARYVGDTIIHDQVLKPEVTLSDIYEKLQELYGNEPKAERLFAAIKPWLKGGSRPLFDGQTYFGEGVSTNIDDAKIVTFDISELEEGSLLRKLGYHVCLTWIWQIFVKSQKNALRKKIVIADEFWQMVDNEQTVSFAERLGRRCRKRNTSFIIASQDAQRIFENKKARGVVTNASIQILLKQNQQNHRYMKESFDLSEGEASIIMGKPRKGEGLLRVQDESVWIRTDPFEFERVLFESNQAKMAELEEQMRNFQAVSK